MRASAVATRVLLVAVTSVLLWVVSRPVLGRAVQQMVVAGAAVLGERSYPIGADRIGLLTGAAPGADRVHLQGYGVSLTRWHVNVIAGPILVAVLVRGAPWPCVVLSAATVALTLVLDAVAVLAYLVLGVKRLGGTAILGAAIDHRLADGIAIFGSKVAPVVAFGLVYAVWSRRNADFVLKS